MPEVFWVDALTDARIAVFPRPRGWPMLDDEARQLRADGITFVVSLLTPDEERALQLEREGEIFRSRGLKFRSFPIPDGMAPDTMDAPKKFVGELVQALKAGETIGVHCRAGIGRSPMMVAAILVAGGVPLPRALAALSRARGWPVPETEEQLQWLARFAASL